MPVAPAPPWLVAALADRPVPKGINPPIPYAPATASVTPRQSPWVVQPDETLETHSGASQGERRFTLCRLAGRELGLGRDGDEVLAMAERWASRCSPPMTDWRRHTEALIARQDAIAFVRQRK